MADAAAAESGTDASAQAVAGFSPAVAAPRPQPATLRDVASMVRRSASFIQNFNILNVPGPTVNQAAVEETIRSTLGPTLSALCEVVHMYDCDVLLLTGRPSSWNGVIATVLAKLPVPPDRESSPCVATTPDRDGIRFLPTLRAALPTPRPRLWWGPFCVRWQTAIWKVSFDSGALKLTSTARYIGEMDINSQLNAPRCGLP